MTDEQGSVPTDNSGDTVVEEAPLPPQQFSDEMQQMQFTLFQKMIAERNALVADVNAAAGNKEDLLNFYRETDTSDPALVAAREAWSQAYLDLMAIVEPKVEARIADSKGSQEEAEAKIKDLDGKIKPGLNLYRKLYEDLDPNAMKYFTKQERVKGVGIRSGSGVRRLRNLAVDITIDGETTTFENFSTAAKHLDWDTGDLQKAFFDKAGTEDPKKFPAVTSFSANYVETDKDNNETEKDAFIKVRRTDNDNDAPESNEVEEEAPEEGTDEYGGPSEEDLNALV